MRLLTLIILLAVVACGTTTPIEVPPPIMCQQSFIFAFYDQNNVLLFGDQKTHLVNYIFQPPTPEISTSVDHVACESDIPVYCDPNSINTFSFVCDDPQNGFVCNPNEGDSHAFSPYDCHVMEQ